MNLLNSRGIAAKRLLRFLLQIRYSERPSASYVWLCRESSSGAPEKRDALQIQPSQRVLSRTGTLYLALFLFIFYLYLFTFYQPFIFVIIADGCIFFRSIQETIEVKESQILDNR